MFEKLSDAPVAEVQNEQVKEWKEMNLLQKCVDERKDCRPFIFYEGPPTANGKPGIHHVMARTLKDSVNRYKTMKGFKVNRKAGWDTHGLPVEIEVEKQLGFDGKQDIEKYGIKEFNQKCRESVFKYLDLWENMSERMGYLADMDDPYITLDNNYIESGWWILKEFFKAGLIYEGYKIVPYCPRCGTGLASHEVAQGYKDIKVNTLTVKFKKKGTDNEYFLAWTTTPWTLAANTVLTVGPDIDYVRVRYTAEGDDQGNIFYLAKALADKVLGEENYEILDEMKGKDLEYQEYEQLEPFCKPDGKAFFVTCMDYVSVEDGTGIVHTAPAFGEDDYNCGKKYNLPMIQPVDLRGRYTETPWKGRFIMEDGLDVEIIKYLAQDHKIFKREKLEHAYPHCWRCGTPLVYYAQRGWYIKMSDLRDQLVANNKTVNWWPPFVGEGRFGNWIADVKDWAISRSRYWGTPIPIWRCECGHLECIGSRKELVEKSIEDIDESIELHRPYVDDVHIKCPECGKTMTRIPEVMDCWFDSGAMPYAQWHYPFEHKDDFDQLFPADFICEGIDQTRGWFYSLMAISTFIKGQAPYKNVLVNDLILDKNGKKMSKHVGNTVDPFQLFDKYGADATRWYLLSVSPAWTPTKFDEEGLKDVVSKFFGTLRNVYNFFVLYADLDDVDMADMKVDNDKRPELDRWILSKYNKLVRDVTDSMEHYDHMKSVRAITNFVEEDLSNWYIRRARRRFYAAGMTDDKKSVYDTTFTILEGLSRLIAPFAPFISEEMYKKLNKTDETVHVAYYPEADLSLIDEKEEERMDLVKQIANLGRGIREKESIKVRQPLAEVLVDGKYKDMIEDLSSLIMEELNVKKVVFADDLTGYMNFQLKPDFRAAGPVLGKNVKLFAKELAKVEDPAALVSKLDNGETVTMDLGGQEVEIGRDLVDVRINSKEGFAVSMANNVFAILDTEITPELETEGLAREIVSKIQQMRKQKDFEMMDRINISIKADADVMNAVSKYEDVIKKETLADTIEEADDLETVNINGHETGLSVARV
ncbi:MAG: isoleucine--tRNA ligase [Eubacteriales bacterium]|nr:isoleucine--tRNA ligase [Eubacteriales bacterium]